jgi:hypothetical protein
MDLETKLKNLLALRKGTTGADADSLNTDIRNIERALEIERELRSPVGTGTKFPPTSRPVREVRVVEEADQEFRTRAERELAAIGAS